ESPSLDALQIPGGASMIELMRLAPHRADQVFSEFDFRAEPDARAPVIVSCGELSPRCDGLDFEPYVARAEALGEFYRRVTAPAETWRVLGRDWFCISDSNLATVQLYYGAG